MYRYPHEPALTRAQCIRHDVRAKQRAQSPHGVQPAHVTAFIVDRDIVVQRGVDAACSQSIRNREQQQHPVIRRDRETEQSERRQCHGYHSDLARAESQSHSIGQQRGHNGARRNGHGNATLPGNRRIQIGAHRRPGGPEHGIRQAQTDESHINHGKQQISMNQLL